MYSQLCRFLFRVGQIYAITLGYMMTRSRYLTPVRSVTCGPVAVGELLRQVRLTTYSLRYARFYLVRCRTSMRYVTKHPVIISHLLPLFDIYLLNSFHFPNVIFSLYCYISSDILELYFLSHSTKIIDLSAVLFQIALSISFVKKEHQNLQE